VGNPTKSETWLLRGVAAFNVVAHLLGLAAAGVGMRPGSPLVSLEDRMAYLAGAPLAWSLAWGVWMVCALALVAFLALAARRLGPQSELARTAVLLAAAGMAVDLFCEAVQMTVLPLTAALGQSAAGAFVAWERAAGAGGLVAANGLYSLATLLLALALRGGPGAQPARVLGVATFVGGMALVASGFTGDARLAAVATVLTIGCYCAWVVAVTRTLERQMEG
jgi:hypothetical protein